MDVLTGIVNKEQVYCPSSDRETSLTLILSSCQEARTSSILLSLKAGKKENIENVNYNSRQSQYCKTTYFQHNITNMGLYSTWNLPGQNTGEDSLSLLQGIFPTQGLNPGPPHCRQILYQLIHKGSPRIYWSGQPIPSPADLPYPAIELGSPALQADSLPTELSGKTSWP